MDEDTIACFSWLMTDLSGIAAGVDSVALFGPKQRWPPRLSMSEVYCNRFIRDMVVVLRRQMQ